MKIVKAKQKILIIGSDGYIGSALSIYLKNKNFKVTTLDTGYFRDGTLIKNFKANLDIDVRNLKKTIVKKFDCNFFKIRMILQILIHGNFMK